MIIIRLRSESSFLKFRIFDFNFYSASSSMPLTAFITYNTQNQYTVESDKLKIVLIEIAIFCVVRHNRTLSEAILGIKKKKRENPLFHILDSTLHQKSLRVHTSAYSNSTFTSKFHSLLT